MWPRYIYYIYGTGLTNLARGCGQEDGTAPCLGHPELAGLEDAEGALVAHPHQSAHAENQHHRLLEAGKVPHILQDKVARPDT